MSFETLSLAAARPLLFPPCWAAPIPLLSAQRLVLLVPHKNDQNGSSSGACRLCAGCVSGVCWVCVGCVFVGCCQGRTEGTPKKGVEEVASEMQEMTCECRTLRVNKQMRCGVTILQAIRPRKMLSPRLPRAKRIPFGSWRGPQRK